MRNRVRNLVFNQYINIADQQYQVNREKIAFCFIGLFSIYNSLYYISSLLQTTNLSCTLDFHFNFIIFQFMLVDKFATIPKGYKANVKANIF